jgi:hypothetical protein
MVKITQLRYLKKISGVDRINEWLGATEMK